MNTQMNEQITKHNNLIAFKEKALDKAGGVPRTTPYNPDMVRQAGIDRIKGFNNLMKANVMDIEHFMSLGVQEGVYTENFYKEHVERFMEEINGLSRLG